MIYRYDGSYPGFLCCVFESFVRKALPLAIEGPEAAQLSFFEGREIPTEAKKAARVEASLAPALGARAEELVHYAFLSGRPEKELLILRFLHMAFARGRGAAWDYAHPDAATVLDLEKAVRGEAHLLTGFVRFQVTDGMLGAVIRPKNYVLPLLRPHFCGRYPDKDFLIADLTHRTALVYQGSAVDYAELPPDFALPPPDAEEAEYQALWKRFYQTIGIRERYNPTVRRTHCPKRYWACMTELQDER